ncbi:MAG: hypothetical protein JSU72_15555 [Deltaproteobacteria bacterium]|nr:MAG: hypothetical protein JSU72_15555 [Deltaproteobacteria bacterium]
MRVLISVIILLLIGCSGETANEKTASLYDKIYDLQSRQLDCINDYTPQHGKVIDGTIFRVFDEAMTNIRYNREEADHWQTSNETEMLKTGDCEDIAVYLVNAFRQAGFPDSQIGCIIAEHPDVDDLHVFAFAGDYWVMDSVSGIQPGSFMFGPVGWKKKVGFNFFEVWDY